MLHTNQPQVNSKIDSLYSEQAALNRSTFSAISRGKDCDAMLARLATVKAELAKLQTETLYHVPA